MALSDATKGMAGSVAPAGKAPEVPQAGATKKGGKDIRHEKMLASGQSIRAKMSEEEKALEGSKSDKVVFVAALGDPNKPQARREGKEDKPSFVVVGYAFKAKEDMTVPKANLNSNFKSFMDVGEITEVPVKAGETFYLNVFETGALISRPEYAGKFTGDGVSVQFTVKFSNNREEPLPVLNKSGKGSIKENMILVADMVGATGDSKGTPQVKAEFAEKFGVLYEKRAAVRRSSAAGNNAAGESTSNMAAAFNEYLKHRK